MLWYSLQAEIPSTVSLPSIFAAYIHTIIAAPNPYPSIFTPVGCDAFHLQAEIPIQVIFPSIFATMIYLLVGFPLEAKPYFLFVLFVVLTSNAAISLG